MISNFYFIILLLTLTIFANGLTLNPNSIGRGGVDIAIGDNPNSILNNPSNLNNIVDKRLTIEPIDSSISLNKDTVDFLTELSSDFDNAKKVSELMKKNIGKRLSFRANNFTSIYSSYNNFSWLLGLQYDMSGHFITHSGFGSIGAMESYIERYKTIIGSISSSYKDIKYGVTIRGVEKYLTTHNYSIGEMIENDSFIDYFDNKYTQKEGAIAVDMGIKYRLKEISDTKVALSILNIGDTTFKELGSTPSIINIGVSSKYNDYLFGIDYIDLFGAEQDSSFRNSIRVGVSRDFFNKSLTLSSGILHETFTFGVEYHYSILNISINSFREEEYNYEKNRKYQLAFSIKW
jgi:hypothetical protein